MQCQLWIIFKNSKFYCSASRNNIKFFIINNAMEKYDDEKITDNFEQMARAYSKSLKNKGFVFIKLEEEEYSLLLDEIAILFCKINASLDRLKSYIDCTTLRELTACNQKQFRDKFNYQRDFYFKNIENPSNCFLSLISLENMLTLKLMILAVKSGELEFCHGIITSRTHVYANSFSIEGFILKG